LQYGGIVVARPGTMIGLGELGAPETQASLVGTVVLIVLMGRKVRGAMLLGIGAAAIVGALHGLVRFEGIVGFPRIEEPAIGKLDIVGVFREKGFLSVLFVLLFLDFFDSVGTLLGVGEAGGLLRDGEIPRSKQAFLSDAIGTSVGALLGTSTISSYIESAAGIAEGARTGLASVVTACLLLLSILFYPLVRAIGGGIETGEGAMLYPFIAPPLIVVGSLMLRTVRSLDWEDPTEYLPAFLPMVIIPFSFSISEGIAFGFIAHALLKTLCGRAREVHPLLLALGLLFLFRDLFL
jgi:AGZA family xanthine/uracil permease-like MFS transporter